MKLHELQALKQKREDHIKMKGGFLDAYKKILDKPTQQKVEKKVYSPKPETKEVKTTPTQKPQKQARPQKPLSPALEYLINTYPKAFDLNNRKPLKCGIHKDIMAALPEGKFTLKEIQKAIHFYKMSVSYEKNMVELTHRIDLNGNEVEEITAEHKEFARQNREEREKKSKGN